MNLNPLNVSTSSSVFSFAINQALLGRSRAAVIGIGNDLDLWWSLSNFFPKLKIYESEKEWRELCQQRLSQLQKTAILHNINSNISPIKPYENHFFMSALSQSRFLSSTNMSDSTKRDKISSALLSSDLYQELHKQSFDWIYVDGPLGGYNSETDFQSDDNRGRMETISASILSLKVNDITSFVVIDDCHRFIESQTINLWSPFLDLKNAQSLCRNTYAFSIRK